MEEAKGRFVHNARQFLVLKVEITEVRVTGGGHDWMRKSGFLAQRLG